MRGKRRRYRQNEPTPLEEKALLVNAAELMRQLADDPKYTGGDPRFRAYYLEQAAHFDRQAEGIVMHP